MSKKAYQFLVKSFQLSDLILVGYQIVTNWANATKVVRVVRRRLL